MAGGVVYFRQWLFGYRSVRYREPRPSRLSLTSHLVIHPYLPDEQALSPAAAQHGQASKEARDMCLKNSPAEDAEKSSSSHRHILELLTGMTSKQTQLTHLATTTNIQTQRVAKKT